MRWAGGLVLLLGVLAAGCSAMCVCTDDRHMRSGRMSAFMSRMTDVGEFLESCREACTQ